MLRVFIGMACFSVFITGCADKPTINDDLVYEALNQVIQQDSLFARVVCAQFSEAEISDKIQMKYFSGDKKFINYQLETLDHHNIDTGRLFYYWKPGILAKSAIDTSCSKEILYRFSYPVFSKDLQTFFVEVNEDCNCLLGGGGYKVIFRRQNGKWVKMEKVDEWIS